MTGETGRVLTPEEVVANYLAGLPYDFPDDANPQIDAAGAIFALYKAGYRLYRPVETGPARTQP